MATLTSEAKQLLSATVRSLRQRLLQDLRDEAHRRYRLSVPIAQAGLDEAHRRRRQRLDGWLDEQVRAAGPKPADEPATRAQLLRQAEQQAAATLLNRLVCLRHFEALGLTRRPVVKGGRSSQGYRELRELGPGLTDDETEGYATLLKLVFDELAVDLPGLFGDVGLTSLLPIPPATLREVVERLDDPQLASAWTDDTTLGWVYQYYNDPEREALDRKISSGGKIEPHEIASKTQLFTERYLVEWLLHNSLGLLWLCICRKHGWTADAERVLPVLAERRAEWRRRRAAGALAPDALMPIEGELEERWKYYVPQPIPAAAVAQAPDSIHRLRLLDPACGSGHFLVIAFDLLAALYREEARHCGQALTDREIAEAIIENNLHGIDIDPRAIQIAAAGLYTKAKQLSFEASPKRVNLVAPALKLGRLPQDDPSLLQLCRELQDEVGISREQTGRIVAALAGVDHLGSLCRVGAAVEEILPETEPGLEGSHRQEDLFGDFRASPAKPPGGAVKATILAKLERFLAQHSGSEDLGLRLGGEHLATGVRFVRMVREGSYDLVVGNPPYQSLAKTVQLGYVAQQYPRGKADIYAAFLERSLELARPGGTAALLTMRGWMFLNQYRELRQWLLSEFDLRSIGDFAVGAFAEVPNDHLTVAVTTFRKSRPAGTAGVAIQPTPMGDRSYDRQRTKRKHAATLAQVGRYEFDPRWFGVIEGEPIVYWWSRAAIEQYARAPKLGELCPAREGLSSASNDRFIRRPWELSPLSPAAGWVPYVRGADGRCWMEPVEWLLSWSMGGLAVRVQELNGRPRATVRNERFYGRVGIAFTTIGQSFAARLYRVGSHFDTKGRSVFPDDVAPTLCSMNSAMARDAVLSLNPGLDFTVSDVNRLPLFPIQGSEQIVAGIIEAFGKHEAAREGSAEFRRPGRSPWRYAQQWAQQAVDRPGGEPLPPYEPELDGPEPSAFISFGVGVALGRFGAAGEGILAEAPASALPHGLLFVSATPFNDSLAHPACALLRDAWQEHGPAVSSKHADLNDYLRRGFFGEIHRRMYENRPIYLPLSSAKRSFVAYAVIHRWQDDTLQVLLADHLVPERRRLAGQLADLRHARLAKGRQARAEKRFAEVQKLLAELSDFIATVTEIAERGPPPPDARTPPREQDARFAMDLDDGVMVNSAALWPLLLPQWQAPKQWWQELATARGRKDYDWSQLAARYFPARVAGKCRQDPSLAVAHKCFWHLWPAKAYAWELRLQDESRPDCTIAEPRSAQARRRFVAEHPAEAAAIRAAEAKRRARQAP